MTRRARIAFLALVAAQALVPVGMAALKEAHLAFDRKVVLLTEPIDPLDVFRGRYIRLSYEISTLPVAGDVAPGSTVYVPLRREGDHWTGDQALTYRPDDDPFIRGRVTEDGFDGESRIEYGIETYFLDERRADELDDRTTTGTKVEVALDDDGDAQIVRLILPG